jgi:hypothetical protein
MVTRTPPPAVSIVRSQVPSLVARCEWIFLEIVEAPSSEMDAPRKSRLPGCSDNGVHWLATVGTSRIGARRTLAIRYGNQVSQDKTEDTNYPTD